MKLQNNAKGAWGAPPLGVTVLILCGGRGERLRPLTDSVPKPLLPVNGRPLIEHLLRHLFRQGVADFVLCTGYKAELFEEFAGQVELGDASVQCLDSGGASISERLRQAREQRNGRSLICYGDTLADVNIAALEQTHCQLGVEATLTAHPYRSDFGLVSFDEMGLATGFVEKPQLPYWINIGFILCEPAALERLEEGMEFPEFLKNLARGNHLGVYRHRGGHWTANTEIELRELAEQLRNNGNLETHHYDAQKL